MKVSFSLKDHKNDKGTGFAGSLHAGCVLAALNMLESVYGDGVLQNQQLLSTVAFKRPVTTDFAIEAEVIEHQKARCWVLDDQGLKVKSTHECVERAVRDVQADLQKNQSEQLEHYESFYPQNEVQECLAESFPVSCHLNIESICSDQRTLVMKRYHKPFSQGGDVNADLKERVFQDLLSAYLSAWSLATAMANQVGENDVLVARASSQIDLNESRSYDQQSQLTIAAKLSEQGSSGPLKEQLRLNGKTIVKIEALGTFVRLQGLFHVRVFL